MGFLRVGNGVLILANPRWIIDFNIAAFAAYTAAEIAFIVSVDAIVQPSVRSQQYSFFSCCLYAHARVDAVVVVMGGNSISSNCTPTERGRPATL